MGRFLVIVVLFVALALVINSSIKKQAEKAAPEPEAKIAEATEPASPKSKPDSQPEAKPAEPTPGESASADGESTTAAPTPNPNPTPEPKTAPAEPETVLLGSGDLLTGIPGEGDLTVSEIEAWLAEPKNNVVLKPELPLGLAAGAAEIKGIDKNPMTRAKIELGRQLYFDTRVSSDNTISCASCHDPNFGYAKDTQFGIGVGGQQGGRNSPTAYNRILSGPQFWDGRADSLEDQAVGPIANSIEMGNTHEAFVAALKEIPGYVKQFESVFGDSGDPVNIDNVGRAIATFERAIVTNPAPWDYYQQVAAFEKGYADDLEYIREEQAKGEPELEEEDLELWKEYQALRKPLESNPISESAIRGGELFFSDKAGCTACHLGANFADEKYHNLGVGMMAAEPDLGRYDVTQEDKDRGAFKTPTVRNVSQTAPYMHDGSQKTLLEVVEWYAKGGHPNPHLSEKVKKLDLTDQDKQDLVAFMAEGLLGELPMVETGRLPE